VLLLKALKTLFYTLWWIIKIVFSPIIILLKMAIKPVLLYGYHWYLKFYSLLKRSAFVQNRILFLFSHKYFIHVVIVLMAIFVTGTNIKAKELNNTSDFGKQSALYKIVQESNGEMNDVVIVEKGLIQNNTNSQRYLDTSGSIVSNVSKIDPDSEAASLGDKKTGITTETATMATNTQIQTKTGHRAEAVEYTVKNGENIGIIANRFGISSNSILWANDLSDNAVIKPGDTIKIPPASGYTYQVAQDDTLEKIIAKYSGDMNETIKINGIGEDHIIPVGSKIIIVGGKPPPPPTPIINNSYLANSSSSNRSSSSDPYVNRNAAAKITGGKLNWPIGCQSRMTTYWGHAGNARDFPCPIGTPIYAATEGVFYVRFTGQIGHGYGNCGDVVGPNGITTRYAHMSYFNVSNGQHVSRGQVLGFVGMTGRTTGPHLHFEVHINGRAYDPIQFY